MSAECARVFFVDYGNSEDMPYNQVKELAPRFSKLPFQVGITS